MKITPVEGKQDTFEIEVCDADGKIMTMQGTGYTVRMFELAKQHGAFTVLVPEPEPAATTPTMADLYPKYYRRIPKGMVSMDTYAVNMLFAVDDPSGCILHSRKKLLLAGTRTGGKSMFKDITEARDTLTRYLDLNPEKVETV